MDVSVVMIHYNTYELTRDALNSIFEQTKGLEYEVILIDNQSPDGSGERLKEEFRGRLIYIQAGGNLGTSKSFNLGVRQSCGKYILWLNPDILLKENFIDRLFSFMEAHETCGICGGNVLDFNGKPNHSFRRELISVKTVKKDKSFLLTLFRRLFRKQLSSQYNYTGKPREVGYVTGADMMIRREALDAVGGFDEDIFMYSEEVEFTYRVKKNTSYTVMSVPDAHIYHLEGASFQTGKGGFRERRYRNSVIGDCVYFRKCYGDGECIRFLKTLKRSYLKIMFVYLLTFQEEKYAEYEKKREILTEYLNRYPEFMERR